MELKGKIIDFLGDSLTEGLQLKDDANRYDNYIARTCGLKKANNYGIGGTRIAFQSRPSEKAKHDLDFCGRCYLMDPEADIIVVFGGTNDYGHGDAPFGQIGDKTRTTFCGAVDYLINKIRELYPSAKLVMVTPGHRFDDATTPPIDKYQRLGIEGRQLEDYVDAMMTIARSYDVPILNLLEKLDIDPKKSEDREKYTRDGLHYNDEGHVKLGECLAEFLKSL